MSISDPDIARALESVAVQLKYLGTGNAGTTMGALEFVAVTIREGCERIAQALEDVERAIKDMRPLE